MIGPHEELPRRGISVGVLAGPWTRVSAELTPVTSVAIVAKPPFALL